MALLLQGPAPWSIVGSPPVRLEGRTPGWSAQVGSKCQHAFIRHLLIASERAISMVPRLPRGYSLLVSLGEFTVWGSPQHDAIKTKPEPHVHAMTALRDTGRQRAARNALT